jgi:hypothetical protein
MRYVLVLALVAAIGGCGGGSHMPSDAGMDATPDAAPPADAPPADAPPDAPACTSACAAGQTQCAADGTLVTCMVDAQGCGTFPTGGGAACGPHQACAAGASACTCIGDPACPMGPGDYCDAATGAVTTCSTDAQTCVYVSDTTTCTSPAACADSGGGGHASCVCPATGTAAGEGCATVGATACGGNDILTCQAAGGCQVWVDTGSCSGVGLTCAASGGAAACVCPAAGPTYVADPNAVPLSVSGIPVAPTGAPSPSGCRFAQLGTAISAAQAYVFGTGASATAKVESASAGTFAAETWPVAVPASVTVTSDDSATPPSRYTLAPPSGEPAATVEGGGALGGLAIAADLTAASSPAAVTLEGCTAAAPSASVGPVAITFTANATGDGVHVADPGGGGQACAATITGATITGAYDGISVSSAAGASPTTAAATITGTAIAGSRDAGLLVYQTGAAGVHVTGSTIAGSAHAGAFLDTATLAAHQGTLAIGGTLGKTTIANSAAGAVGVEVDNSAAGQARSGAELDLTDTTIDGSGGASGDGIDLHGATATLTGVFATGNHGNQLAAIASDVTMTFDPDDQACVLDGMGVGKAGILVDAGTTLNATDVVAQNNTAWGVDIRNTQAGGAGSTTTVALTGGVIDFNSDGGLTIDGRDALDTSSLAIADSRFVSNTGQGIAVYDHAAVTISGATHADSNSGSGLYVDGPSSTVRYTPGTSSPTFTGNTRLGIDQITGGTTLTGTAAAPVKVIGNQNDGVDVLDGSFSGTELDVNGNTDYGIYAGGASLAFTLVSSDVSNNDLGGIAILNSHAVANAAQLTGCTVSGNGASGDFGIVIQASLVPPSGASTVISGCTVDGNGTGIDIGANDGNPVSVEVSDTRLEANKNVGILYSSSATTNAITLTGNYIEGNGTWPVGSSQVGGVAFESVAPKTMTFSNNIVGNNGGNQVAFYLNSTASTSYDLSAGGNQLVNCTPASGFYAVYSESPSPGQLAVDADNNQWSDTTFPGTNVLTSGHTTVSTQNAIGGATCPGP